eukprot:9138807-Karenia_brevis.AAC.1
MPVVHFVWTAVVYCLLILGSPSVNALRMNHTVQYTDLETCVYCKGSPALVSQKSQRLTHTASIWNGIRWTELTHGTKECYSCRTHYKLTYVASKDGHQNTIQEVSDDTIILVNAYLGFTYSYIHSFFLRLCRCGVSAQAEAQIIAELTSQTCVDTSKSDQTS